MVERIPLALLSALLMGGAVAFFFFAMPMVLLEQGVIASGLPTLIAAAGPPLGATARTLVALAFALLSGGLTWLVITGIGMIGRPRIRRPQGADETRPIEAEPAGVRDRTPARRPIFATRELPIPEIEERQPEIEEAVFVDAWPEADLPEFPSDDVLELVEPIAEKSPKPAPEAQEPVPIAELMARLEAGAERRAAAKPATPIAPHEEVARPNGFDGALRDALEELQRMATR